MNSGLIEKIDLEDLIKDFKIMNVDVFTSYLKEDLAQRSDDKAKGLNKITFVKYYDVPGIICDRLFAVFDKNKNDYLDVMEFIEGMTILFAEDFDGLSKFIFDFYDFDKDGKISKEDVRVVLSYIPLTTKNYSSVKLKFEQEEFKDRIESQDELHTILEKSFQSNEYLNQKQFIDIIQNVSSEMFIYILIFLMEQRPFSKKTLGEYEGNQKRKTNSMLTVSKSPITAGSHLIASPSLHSKFSPVITISKSPSMNKRSQFSGSANVANAESKNFLLQFAAKKDQPSDAKLILLKPTDSKGEHHTTDENVMVKNIPVNRKQRNNLKTLEHPNDKKNNDYNDLPLMPAVKYQSKNEQIDSDSDEENEGIKLDGFLYKLTHSKKLKKLWFKLVHRDLYYYKTKEDSSHKGMHNLSGVFIKEEPTLSFDGVSYFAFSVVYPKKARVYYVDNEADFKQWTKYIRKATGYSNLTDIYDVKEKLGNGKFGLVRLGIHKDTGRKVAVKIMNKKDMTIQDLELVRAEIEILKICQHPNIIRLYDIFENLDFIYIIMEFCSGGDLFSYIEKRGFRVAELRAAQIIHKLSTAVFYLHSYGIAHRDLKPENILMTDSSDDADIRLLDFGLSKIIGPNEYCTEPFGTLSYVGPEVLLEKPYDKSVDLWSIGIITYLLLCGCLPFDDEHSEREIARQTIHDNVPYPSNLWKKISNEAKLFVDNLLQKDPSKRLSMKDVLEHPWIQKFNKTKLPEMRRKSRDLQVSTFKMYTITDENANEVKK